MTGIRGSLAGVASKPPRTVATSPAVIMLNAAVMSAFCRFPRSSQQALRRAFLVHSELDGVGRGGHKRGHGPREILDTSEEARLVEEAVVDRDIEAAAGLRIEGPIQACRFHGEEMRWTATKARRRRALGCVAHPRVKVLPAGERHRGTCPPLVGVRDEKRLRRARGSRLLDRSIGKIRRGSSFFGFDEFSYKTRSRTD